MKTYKYFLQGTLFLLGLFIFVRSIQAVGLKNLEIILPSLENRGYLVFFIYPFLNFWDAWGWKVVFPSYVQDKVKFSHLFFIRLAGEAINNITPFVDIGGEPLKISLLDACSGIGKKLSIYSIVIGRSILFFSEIIFWILGAGLILFYFHVPSSWKLVFFVTIFIFILLCIFIFASQRKGFFITFTGHLNRLKIDFGIFKKFKTHFQHMDHEIALFYSGKDSRFLYSMTLYFLGWLAGSVEIYFMFWIVGAQVSVTQAIILESLLQLVRSVSFFIPLNLGAQEAGLALIASWMGYSPASGVAVSLIKRIRQLIWVGIGFVIWGFYIRIGKVARTT